MEQSTSRFTVIVVANFFFFLNFSQLMLLPKYVVHLGYGPHEIGLVMGTFSITVLVALPLVGMVADHVSRRSLFLLGALLMGLSTPLYARVESLGPGIYVLRVLQGLGFASAFGITGALVFDVAAEARRIRYLGILTTSGILTHALGPVIGENVIRALGFTAYFYSAAAFGGVALLIGGFLPAKAAAVPLELEPLAGIRPVLAATAALGLVFGGAVIYLPPYLLSLGRVDSSPFFIAFVGGTLAVWGLFHHQLGRMPYRRSWMLMVLFFVALPLAAPVLGRPLLLVGLALLFGAGYGYLYPTLNAHMIGLYPHKRGLANTLFVWGFNIGMLAASLGLGPLCRILSYPAALMLSGMAGLVMLGAYGRGVPHAR